MSLILILCRSIGTAKPAVRVPQLLLTAHDDAHSDPPGRPLPSVQEPLWPQVRRPRLTQRCIHDVMHHYTWLRMAADPENASQHLEKDWRLTDEFGRLDTDSSLMLRV